MSFVTATNRLLFSSRLFFAAFVLIAVGGLALGESAALSDSYRQIILSATAGLCVAMAFAALVLELLERAERLETQADELTSIGEALRESEARLLDFALTSSDWFWETDTAHRIIYVSEGVRRFGLDSASWIEKAHWDIDIDAALHSNTWRDHIATLSHRQVFQDIVFRCEDEQGGRHDISISGRPVFDASGVFEGYRGTARDVTEKLAAEKQLHEAMRAAEQASVAKTNFLANMNHELRTPLNAIIGFSEMLALGMVGALQPRVRDYVEVIHKSASHLHEIVNDVLDFATIEAGKLDLVEENCDPSSIISRCVEMVSAQARARNVKVAIENSNVDLPILYGDERRLRQVLLNLLSNAVKFSPSGGAVVVRPRQFASGGFAIDVHDNGPGMTAEEVTVALERFGQVDAGLERRYEGTGLGLPLARSLVELHGGVLSIESVKGRGTTASMVLPSDRVIAADWQSALEAQR